MESNSLTLFCSILMICTFTNISTAIDTITANQTIKDVDNSTIVSAKERFQMGFFSPGNSKSRYLGIWYKNIANQTVVWVANRDTPLADTLGVLMIDASGVLVLSNGENKIIWSSNSSKTVMSPVVQLLDTGNLVIRYADDNYPENFLWQSFDHLGDTILPGMKFGWDMVKRIDRYLISWKSPDDPSPGNYTYEVYLKGYPQRVVWKGSAMRFRFGPWNGVQFGGKSHLLQNMVFTYDVVSNEKDLYYMFRLLNSSAAMRMVLDSDGDLKIFTWTDTTQGWDNTVTLPTDECDDFAFCGGYGICNITKKSFGLDICECLEGFEPKYPEKWRLADRSDGCVRKSKLMCGNKDSFKKYPNLKFPDTQNSWFDPSMTLEECATKCLKNCSCTAYANIDVKEGGSGCLLWFNDLLDIREYLGNVQDLYVRGAAGELGTSTIRRSRAKKPLSTIIIAVLVVITIFLCLVISTVYRKRKQGRKGNFTFSVKGESTNRSEKEDLELPLFDFITIAEATNGFSENNKLGEGGFGPVYMGILEEGKEIAVKRLSKTSKQGLDEFKNEVLCIAKLQHRNLVKLLGCSIDEEEMLLIYEYMPNGSLDFVIFNKELSRSLNWSKRYNIIYGIAKGLLYLHQDSRIHIIHRDLKAGNILLDHEMNPKISDFGTAKSFWGSESEANTTRVVGTFGYMSPEYALDGIFSFKSDVYSFGVLVLEIISGKRMKGFYQPDPNLNLLGQAWRLYKEEKFLDIIDDVILESCNHSDVYRAIQIALLCVQPYPEDRPSMAVVSLMLSSKCEIPEPKQPGFSTYRKLLDSDSSSSLISEHSCGF
ncbi:Receptor-like serine/threonine-protein kinase [Heracleum sosnowskyi]|uniref:Receptor-like serine/threonine-protein kinase n=1 Tax=Heracleum sosnowskyi TaxID=360622 RepID=A0AAD8MMN0_9APIA|nr:Receptor-like serine/threonine-protein kinase [Heracleum sosnowskyi]